MGRGLWYTFYRGRNAKHGSAAQSAISAIDIALWDIVGQKLNVPVYRLKYLRSDRRP